VPSDSLPELRPGPATPPPGEGRLVLGRFALESACASGGHGTVWRARDRVTGGVAAVKVLPGITGEALLALRREVAALRLLRIPGVVPLLDAGAEAGVGLVAMQWIDGAPFTAALAAPSGAPSTPERWTQLAPTVVALLETLARVHAAGIVHRDLKPANVLVDTRGVPTLVDLGIASGAALQSRGPTPLAGTPRYMAPALFEGAAPSPTTDIFSLAVFVFEALTGDLPRPDDLGAVVAGEGLARTKLRARLATCAPQRVAVAFADVLAQEGRGHSSAEELLRALGAADPAPLRALAVTLRGLVPPHAEPCTRADDLTPLFRAEERVLGHASAAARHLHEAAGGHVAALLSELARWLAQGIGRVRNGRLVLEELDVERIEQRRGQRSILAQQGLTRSWISTGIIGLTEGTLAETHARIERGEYREALAELPTLASVAVQLARLDLLADLLDDWLFTALAASDRNALALLLHELERSEVSGVHGANVAAVATAALAALDGATTRARERLAVVPPSSRFALGRSWHAVQIFTARRAGDAALLEQALVAARAWAADQTATLPELDTYEGWTAFHAGDFARAIERHRAAAAAHLAAGESRAEPKPGGARRASALLDAGAAALEMGEGQLALSLAEEALELLRSRRQPFARGRAEWLARAARYRLGLAEAVDHELVRAAPAIGAEHLTGFVLLTEAAVGWRVRDTSAPTLAEAAARHCDAAGEAAHADLARALRDASREQPPDRPWRFDGAQSWLGLQTAELWLRAGGALAPAEAAAVASAWRRAIAAAAGDGRRREVLAPSECGRVAELARASSGY
jgi:hypothetical protein